MYVSTSVVDNILFNLEFTVLIFYGITDFGLYNENSLHIFYEFLYNFFYNLLPGMPALVGWTLF